MIDLLDRPSDLTGMLIGIAFLISFAGGGVRWLMNEATTGISDFHHSERMIMMCVCGMSFFGCPVDSPVPGSAFLSEFYSSLVYGLAAWY